LKRRRWKSRTPTKKSRRKRWFIALIIVVLFTIQAMIFIDHNLKPPLMNLAKVRIKQLATQSINAAITDQISKGGTNFENLIDWKTDPTGKVKGFTLNYTEHMKITSNAINIVQHQLNQLKEIPEHIPLGMAMESPIIASFGPEIPVRLLPVGNVKVDVNTRYQNAGINMILVEVYIRIIAELSVIIPFDSEAEMVETELPISYSLVVGDVPMYYFDNKGNPVGNTKEILPPNISIPNLNNPSSSKESSSDQEAKDTSLGGTTITLPETGKPK
jgi:sporulation protein YunB